MRTAVVVIALLWTVSIAEAGGVKIPKLVEYTDGTVTLLVPKGWAVTVATTETAEASRVEVVPPADVIREKGLVGLTVSVEELSDTVATEIAAYIFDPMRWSKLKGGWVCGAGADAFEPENPAVSCGRKLDDTHWLHVHAFGKASMPALSRLAKSAALSAKGFSVP
jgi:hypothetical protein